MDTNTDTNMNLHSDSESNTGKEFHTVAYTDTRRIPEVMFECQKILWIITNTKCCTNSWVS